MLYARPLFQSAILSLNQEGKEYDRYENELAGTFDQFLATELPYTRSFTLSICTIIFNTLGPFQHDVHDRRGLREV